MPPLEMDGEKAVTMLLSCDEKDIGESLELHLISLYPHILISSYTYILIKQAATLVRYSLAGDSLK